MQFTNFRGGQGFAALSPTHLQVFDTFPYLLSVSTEFLNLIWNKTKLSCFNAKINCFILRKMIFGVRLVRQNYFRLNFSIWPKKKFGLFQTLIFFRINIFWAQNLFGTKVFFGPKFFWTFDFCWDPKFVDPKFFWTKHFFSLHFFYFKSLLEPKIFVWPKIF